MVYTRFKFESILCLKELLIFLFFLLTYLKSSFTLVICPDRWSGLTIQIDLILVNGSFNRINGRAAGAYPTTVTS